MTPEESKESGVDTPNGGLVVEKLTVRQFFAAHAMQGLLAHADPYEGPPPPSEIAEKACENADAILKKFARVGDVGADIPATPPGP